MNDTVMLEEDNTIETILNSLSNQAIRKLSLNTLLQNWYRFVVEVERGYNDSIYEYTNDLSNRDLIENILLSVQPSLHARLLKAIQPWDERFIKATEAGLRPLVNLTSDKLSFFWWSRIPKNLTDELKEDLQAEGLMSV